MEKTAETLLSDQGPLGVSHIKTAAVLEVLHHFPAFQIYPSNRLRFKGAGPPSVSTLLYGKRLTILTVGMLSRACETEIYGTPLGVIFRR